MASITKNYNLARGYRRNSLFRDKYESLYLIHNSQNKNGATSLALTSSSNSPVILLYKTGNPTVTITGDTPGQIRTALSALEDVTGVKLKGVK